MMHRLGRSRTSLLGSIVATLLLLVLTPRFAGATVVGDYLTSSSTVTYTPITGGTTAIFGTTGGNGTFNDDATTGTLAIGFDFIFEGQHYTSLSANTGGLIMLGSGTSSSFANDLAAAPGYPVIAPFWDHQHVYDGGGTAGGCAFTPAVGAHYVLSGTAPNRELVIEFNTQTADATGSYWWSGCGTTMNRYQARLHERTHVVDFVYGSMWTSASQPTAATIGLAQGAADFLSATPSGGTMMTTSAVTSNNDIRMHLTPITGGTVYTFTPCFLLVSGNPAQGGTTSMNNGDTLLSTVSAAVPGMASVTPMTLEHPTALCGTRNYTVAISGASASEYVFQSSGNQALAGSLNVGETLTPTIVFTPAAAGIRGATLVVTDTGAAVVRTYPLAGIGRTTSTTALVSSLNPAYPGQSVTFTATVTGANAGALVATGNVVFKEGANVLGTVPLDGSGQAVFTTSALPEGTTSITAEYAGDTYFVASTSAAVMQVVQKFVSTVSVASSLNPSFVTQTVTLTATVTVPAGAPMATGNVTFMDGNAVLETVALNGSAQAVHVNTTFVSANHAVRVEYAGDATTAAGTSPVLNQVVYRNPVTVAGTSSPNPSIVGQAVTLTVTVAGGAGLPVPTGSVTFSADTGPLGIVALDGAGQAVLVTSTLAAGTRMISMTYPGGVVYPAGVATVAQVVEKNPAEVTVVSSNNPSLVGQPVTFTATVRGSAVGAPAGTGAVIFKEGATVLGTGTLDSNGQATFTTSSLTVGTHSVTVDYAGDGYYNAGTATPVVQTVNSIGASVVLTSSANPSPYAQSVTFTATATGSSTTPTGTMTFKEGTAVLGTGTLNGSGVATYATSALSVGAHTISAEYGGDGVYSAGATGTVTQVINRAATATALVVSTPSTTTGTSITWTATVTSAATGTIGGTVTFNEGLTVIGTGTLGSGGVATTSATLPVGSHDVTATFGGDTNYAPSTSSPVTTIVTQPEAGVDAGPDAPDTGTSIDATSDRTGGSPDGGRADVDAGAMMDVALGDGRGDVIPDTSMPPPPSDVRIDLPIAVPDAPPAADARVDTTTDAVATSDVRADAPRAEGGVDVPPGDDNGCSCRVGQRTRSRGGFAVASALVALTLLRARRRRGEGAANVRKGRNESRP